MEPVRFSAETTKGTGRGKDLGYPTMNLSIPDNLPLQHGIYACRVKLPEENDTRMGALHYGPIPVFDEMQPSLEVHILDYNEEVKPKNLSIEVVKFLRDVEIFDSPEQLIKQIERDVEKTRLVLSDP